MGAGIEAWVWQAVAAELRRHRRAGLGRLLTVDTVRFITARALADAGLDPAAFGVEWPHPVLKGARINLMAGGARPTFFEFKYCREPDEQNAAWTDALGEVLKDFYRLAMCPAPAERLFVYVETADLRRYMKTVAQRYGLDLDTDVIVLRPDGVARLPMTAQRIIGSVLAANRVEALRTVLIDVDATLRLAVYEVDPLGPAPDPGAGHRAPRGVSRPTGPVAPPGPRDGARGEILAAIRAVLARTRRGTFTPAEVVDEMRRRGTGYAETTIRTMVTGHMCRNAPDNNAVTYDDLERVDRGLYRLVRD
ncbi:hypothetical protein AAH991_23495 [Microbispora sp. ZYX-F-249]|uniref:DUF7669 domain-containing protein n=1 Tax=Microbispora maris TaxID=3144104 RepID=A0ABV0ATT8_9ACTN